MRRCGGGGLGSLTLTGLKTGQHMLNEFGARGRQRSVWRWGGLLGLRLWRCGGRGKSRFLAALPDKVGAGGMTIYGGLDGLGRS